MKAQNSGNIVTYTALFYKNIDVFKHLYMSRSRYICPVLSEGNAPGKTSLFYSFFYFGIIFFFHYYERFFSGSERSSAVY